MQWLGNFFVANPAKRPTFDPGPHLTGPGPDHSNPARNRQAEHDELYPLSARGAHGAHHGSLTALPTSCQVSPIPPRGGEDPENPRKVLPRPTTGRADRTTTRLPHPREVSTNPPVQARSESRPAPDGRADSDIDT